MDFLPTTAFVVESRGGVTYVMYKISWTYSSNLPSPLGLLIALNVPGRERLYARVPSLAYGDIF